MDRFTVDPADRHNEECDSCALIYGAFRGGITYREAYHWIAWDREHTSRSAVLMMGHHKRDENLDTSFDFGGGRHFRR